MMLPDEILDRLNYLQSEAKHCDPMTMMLAAHGMGLVIQPTFIASESIRRGNLVPVLTDYDWPISPAYAVYPPTRHLSYRVRALIDFPAVRFAGTPQWDRDCEALSARQT